MPCNQKYLERPQGLSISFQGGSMILEIVMWGFFSAWGWFGASYIKDSMWPPDPVPRVQQPTKKVGDE